MTKLVNFTPPLSPMLQVIVADLQQMEALLPPGQMRHVAAAMRYLRLHFQESQRPPGHGRRAARRRR